MRAIPVVLLQSSSFFGGKYISRLDGLFLEGFQQAKASYKRYQTQLLYLLVIAQTN